MISNEFGPKYFDKIKICLEKRAYDLNGTMISRLYHENSSNQNKYAEDFKLKL